jgi:hypothetical protein
MDPQAVIAIIAILIVAAIALYVARQKSDN